MNKINRFAVMTLSGIVGLAASVSLIFFLVASNATAQFSSADQVLNQIYGGQKTGCTQATVEPTGHNRSGPYTAGRRYLVYGYNASDISVGDALRCVWGTSAVDVTNIGGSKVGQIIFANQQQVFFVKTSYAYISCVSKTASMKYDICPLD